MSGSTIYHFEHELREGEWRAIGAGEGDAAREALEDLRHLSDGDLPLGRYRCLRAFGSTDERWRYLALAEDGSIAHL